MEYLKVLRELEGHALYDTARALCEKDTSAFENALVALTRGGTPSDYEKVGEMLSVVPLRGVAESTYVGARFGPLVSDEYLNIFLRVCEDCGCTAQEYLPLLFYAQYADKDGALYGWDKSVDRYVERLARIDFDGTADYIDRFDKKLGKYVILIAVDKRRALKRLTGMALYAKNIDKAAVRDILMDYEEVAEELIALYGKSTAHDRVSIVRLLCAFKANGKVRRFITDVAANDKSKTVRETASGGMKKQKAQNVPAFFETLMAEGSALSVSEWKELLSDEKYAAVADKIFFGMTDGDGQVCVLVYNDGKFLDKTDRPITHDDSTRIFVLHPLDIASDDGLLSIKISQPFLQLKRPTYYGIEGERYTSSRLVGTMIVREDFDCNFKKYGFTFCSKRAESEPTVAVCRIGEYVIGVECDMPSVTDTVSCGKIAFYRASDVVKLKRKLYVSASERLDIRLIPIRAYSELVYKACLLFGEA